MQSLLVVDDERMIRTLIRKYAEFDGYAVTEAENGMDAVMLCRKNKYDLIIMDIMMPRDKKDLLHPHHHALRARRGIRPHQRL